MSSSPNRLRAGKVGRPHGLDGSFYVLDPVPTLLVHGTELQVGDHTHAVNRRAGTDKKPIVRLEGHDSRESALALRGETLWSAREDAPELGEDEWYAEELEGLSVRCSEKTIGTVTRLRSLPSCDVLEVEREGGGELLVPLVRDAVRSVDLEQGVVEVDLKFLGED